MAEPRQDFKGTELSSYIRNQGPPEPKDKPYAPGFGWLGIVDISVVGQLSSLGSLLLRGQWEGDILSPGISKESSLGLQLGLLLWTAVTFITAKAT